MPAEEWPDLSSLGGVGSAATVSVPPAVPPEAPPAGPPEPPGDARGNATIAIPKGGFGGGGADDAPPVRGRDRYELRVLLGRGGMGEVWRAWDNELSRFVAVKVMTGDPKRMSRFWRRFWEEAQATAGLQHPGIVPVHDLGRLPDGRVYYAMQEVSGRTLGSVIRSLHQEPGREWTLRRVIDAFHRVSATVAFAHESGWLHRDLKPNNVMLGRFGAVYVVDWGLARRYTPGPPRPPSTPGTRAGLVGTPAYMAPEQARGEVDSLGPWSDVHSLGAVLFEILSGRAPYGRATVEETLADVLAGQRAPLPSGVPEELAALCDEALAADPSRRPADAGAFASRLQAWLEGEQAREAAMAEIATADALRPEIRALRQESRELAERAREALALVRPSDPVEAKRHGWALEDEARRLSCEAEVREVRWTRALLSALQSVPDLEGARDRLAAHHLERLEEARLAKDPEAEARFAALHATWRRAETSPIATDAGALFVSAEPGPAEVTLFRVERVERRVAPVRVGPLGVTPLSGALLAAGAWLLELRAADRAPVLLPVEVRAGQVLDPGPVWLPPAGSLGPDEVFVPVVRARLGGDARARSAGPATVRSVGGFVIQRFPVTNAQWLPFVNDLATRGRADDAILWTPRPPQGVPYDWSPGLPVHWITPAAAAAFAGWLAERSGHPWRLPTAEEWEVAARGPLGWDYPWGDYLDPTWANMRESVDGQPRVAPVDSFPGDTSVWGVRGLGGNVMDWCVDEGGRVVARGGWWGASADDCRSAGRVPEPREGRGGGIGFRLVRSVG